MRNRTSALIIASILSVLLCSSMAVHAQGTNANLVTAKDIGEVSTSCTQGRDADACRRAYRYYEAQLKSGVAADSAAAEKAIALVTGTGCAADDGWMCSESGYHQFRKKDATPDDMSQALASYERGCQLGYGPSCSNAGIKHEYGEGTSIDVALATKYYKLGCEMKYQKACQYYGGMPGVDPATVPGYKYPRQVTEERLKSCLEEKVLADCEYAAEAYSEGKVGFRNQGTGVYRNEGTALRAWMTACREYNKHCVAAAEIYLLNIRVFHASSASRNLALGVLEAACTRGDREACTRKTALVAEGGGIVGSYIDPMLDDNERYMLAKMDLDSDEGLRTRGIAAFLAPRYPDSERIVRGRETMEWLAEMQHPDAAYALATAYQRGMANSTGGQPREDNVWDLIKSAADNGHPDAALDYATYKFASRLKGNDERLEYGRAIDRALKLDAPGARELDARDRAQAEAWNERQHRELQEMHRQNVAARYRMDQQTVQRAWDTYSERQKDQEKRDGGVVCLRVMGSGGRSDQTCMTRKHAAKYYRGNF